MRNPFSAFIPVLVLLAFLFGSCAAYSGCSDPALVTGGRACVEITECGLYVPSSPSYLLLTQDLHSNMSCLFLGGNITLDLNGHTIHFIEGPYSVLNNGDFEQWQAVGGKEVPVGWDMSLAPNALKKSTATDMPLIGNYLIWVPAGETLVSDWVYLPIANRSYRGMIVSKRTSDSGYVKIYVENEAGQTVCYRRVPPEAMAASTTSFCNFHDIPAGNYRLRVTPERDHYFDYADIRPAHDRAVSSVRWWSEQWCVDDSGSGCIAPDYAEYFQSRGYTGTGTSWIVIKDGTIQQEHPGFRSYGIHIADMLGGGVNVSNVSVYVNGIRSMSLILNRPGEVSYSLFNSTQTWIVDREDLSEVSIRFGAGMDFHHNSAVGGQGVINPFGNATKIHDNLIRNAQTVTNHYAICLSSQTNANQIYNNVFDPISGSGITVYSSKFNQIINNTFYTRGEVCDPEYNADIFSTNSIRFANYNTQDPSLAIEGTNVSGNRFYITGRYFPGYPNCRPMANAFFVDTGYNNSNFIENNYFEITNTHSKGMANAFYLNGLQSGQYRNNYVISNDAFGYYSRYGAQGNAIFENNTFVKAATVLPNELCGRFSNFRIGYCCGIPAMNNTYLNNTYVNTDPYDMCFSSNYYDPYSNRFQWYLDATVLNAQGSPVSGALVTAVASGAGETAYATTGANGVARLSLTEYFEAGTMRPNGLHNRTYFSPHAVTAQLGSDMVSYGPVNMSGYQQITLNMPLGGACSPDGSTQQCGIDTGVCEFGSRTCTGGAWGACVGAALPSTEVCDGVDNDCDGATDEFLGTTTCGLGVCNHTIPNCIAGVTQACNPLQGQQQENALYYCGDGIDQTCDGSDVACTREFSMLPSNASAGDAHAVFVCNISDPLGIKSAMLLTNESGALAAVDSLTFTPGNYHFMEAEDFAFNAADWELCSQTHACADSRVFSPNYASGMAHMITAQPPTGNFPMTAVRDFFAGQYALWARSFNRDGTTVRNYTITVDSTVSMQFGMLNHQAFTWQKNPSPFSLSGSKTILLKDGSRDYYWDYPDLVLFTDNSTFDPSVSCGNNASALGRQYPAKYSLSTCRLAQTNQYVQFNHTATRESISWACGYVDGTGQYQQSPTYAYFATGVPLPTPTTPPTGGSPGGSSGGSYGGSFGGFPQVIATPSPRANASNATPTPSLTPTPARFVAVPESNEEIENAMLELPADDAETKEARQIITDAKNLEAQGKWEQAKVLWAKAKAKVAGLLAKARANKASYNYYLAGFAALALVGGAVYYSSTLRKPNPPSPAQATQGGDASQSKAVIEFPSNTGEKTGDAG